MDIKTIEEQTTAAIRKLMEKPRYVNKHTFLDEYNTVTRELNRCTAQMEQAVNENRFDDALQIDASIAELKRRKEIMQPALKGKQAQNDFDDADLIAINEEVHAAWSEYVSSTEDRMRELMRKCQKLQKEMDNQQQKVEQCRDMLLARSATGSDFKTQIKFRTMNARNTFIELANDASNYRTI